MSGYYYYYPRGIDLRGYSTLSGVFNFTLFNITLGIDPTGHLFHLALTSMSIDPKGVSQSVIDGAIATQSVIDGAVAIYSCHYEASLASPCKPIQLLSVEIVSNVT